MADQILLSLYRQGLSRQNQPHRFQEGFTLLELLVGIVILAIAAAGTIGIFRAAIQQTRNAALRNERQAAVEQDIGEVLRLNDRYRCGNLPITSAGTANCEIATFNPNENQYAPTPPVTADFSGSGYERFRSLCREGTLTATLITAINALPAPGADVTRQNAVAEAVAVAGVDQSHRYRVTWIDPDGNEIRRLVLSPTVARWCPALVIPIP